MSNVSNIYANTLASQNEKTLLDDEKLRRLIDSDFATALRLLSDFGWGDAQSTGGSADSIISAETDKLVAFVREYAVSSDVRDVLLSGFAFNNIKAAYKARISGTPTEGSVYPAFKDYADAVLAGEYDVLPVEAAEALRKLDENADCGLTAADIDVELTRAEYFYRIKRSKSNPKLNAFVVTQAELTNIITLIRCHNLGRGKNELLRQLLPVPKLDMEEYEAVLTGTREQLKSFVRDSKYAEIIGDIGEKAEKMADIEKSADENLYALLQSGRESFTTSVPFIRYFYRKNLELRMVKTVLVCIKNGRPDEIKRRLRSLDG